MVATKSETTTANKRRDGLAGHTLLAYVQVFMDSREIYSVLTTAQPVIRAATPQLRQINL